MLCKSVSLKYKNTQVAQVVYLNSSIFNHSIRSTKPIIKSNLSKTTLIYTHTNIYTENIKLL